MTDGPGLNLKVKLKFGVENPIDVRGNVQTHTAAHEERTQVVARQRSGQFHSWGMHFSSPKLIEIENQQCPN
jgi:hypothetical protein